MAFTTPGAARLRNEQSGNQREDDKGATVKARHAGSVGYFVLSKLGLRITVIGDIEASASGWAIKNRLSVDTV